MSPFANLPILHEYRTPSPQALERLRRGSAAVVVDGIEGAVLDHTYFRRGLEGCFPRMYLREAVRESLEEAAKTLRPARGLFLFDAFRTTGCQASLFRTFYADIQRQHPDWDEPRWLAETRKYVANPAEKSRFAVSPHNSGGAVDLTLHRDGVPLAMGTGFDETTAASETTFFEAPFRPGLGYTEAQWETFRAHRRILYHAMTRAGFVNYRDEWWHYDLGDCLWAQECGVPWLYGSMEDAVRDRAQS